VANIFSSSLPGFLCVISFEMLMNECLCLLPLNHRSAGLVVLCVMRRLGLSWQEAYEYVLSRRDIGVFPGLKKTLTQIAYSNPDFFEPQQPSASTDDA